jgi:predicted tellurium resistance membrane protein TerC
MLELLYDPNVWIAFATLTVMEIVLGIDNIVFISVLVSRLPREQAEFARKVGIGLALVFRIALLFLISIIVQLQDPVFEAFGHGFSWKDIILIAGGAFLIYKATHEMHAAIEDNHEVTVGGAAQATMQAILLQIVVIDMVFSIDSIITAVGMVPADQVFVMVAAVLVAVGVMFVASGPIAKFVADHPTTKMLALAFLLLIGVTLVADGLGFHIPKGYIYSAMAFSVLVEAVNIFAKGRKLRSTGGAAGKHGFTPFTGDTGSVGVDAALSAVAGNAAPAPAPAASVPANGAAAKPARARPRSTPASRAQSRPKSAPRTKK